MRISTFIRYTLLACLLFTANVLVAKEYSVSTIPNVRLTDARNHVSNPDGILSATDVAQMNQLLNQVEDSLGIEVAVVAIDGIGDNEARMFANELFNHWKLGKQAKDNGLLILLVTEANQRALVFETGYGIEGILPDAVCYRLQQEYMIPDLRNNQFSQGMLRGVAAVSKCLMASDYERAAMTGRARGQQDDVPLSELLWTILGGVFVMVFVSTILSGVLKNRKRVCPRCNQKTLEYKGQRVIREATYQQGGLVENIWRCSNCGYEENTPRPTDRLHRNTGPIIMGGGMGRRSGGGFGGFGGGGGSWGGGRSGGGGSISRF